MNDPRRLREGEDSFVTEVLASAHDDVPGAHVGKRVRAALKVGTVVSVGASAGTALAAGATKSAGTVAMVAVAKWVGALAIAGVAVGGATAYVSRSTPTSTPTTNT